MSSVLSPPRTLAREIYYPESDGKPVAETDTHRDEMFELINALRLRYENAPDVYVTGNVMFYYVEGNPKKCTSPDVMVCFGSRKGKRRTYKLWEEVVPAVVIEVSSRKTWAEDLNKKWRLYGDLGVREYYIHDPEHDYLHVPIIAYRLRDGELEEIKVENGRVFSEVLGLELVDEGGLLRLSDPATGAFLPTAQETDALWREAQTERDQANAAIKVEQERRLVAEDELARLRAELEQLKNG
jgi:Uma2 family endonuclease